MCFRLIGSAIRGVGSLLGLGGGSDQTSDYAAQAAEAARKAAETTAASEEQQRRAQEQRLRKLAAQRGQGATLTRRGLGGAVTAVRQLLGQ